MVAMADQEVPDQDLVTQDLHHPVLAAFHIRAGISMISFTRMAASGSHLKVILPGVASNPTLGRYRQSSARNGSPRDESIGKTGLPPYYLRILISPLIDAFQ
jgi:hypothetical protein